MLTYVATPYTRYSQGHAMAAYHAVLATTALVKRGFIAVSPIIHAHELCRSGHLNNVDDALWTAQSIALLKRCDEMAVILLDGWLQSRGVAREVALCKKENKPIRWFSWPEMEEVSEP